VSGFDHLAAEGILDRADYKARERARKISHKVFLQRWLVEVGVVAGRASEPFGVREIAAGAQADCARSGQEGPADAQVRAALRKLEAGRALVAVAGGGRRALYRRDPASYLWRSIDQLWARACGEAAAEEQR
jgi:hypothetical protein